MRAKLSLLCSLCLLLTGGSILAQSTTDQALDQGIKAYQAYHTSDIDAVNLQNGNVTVKIPLFNLPQRGGQFVSYSLLYNAKQLKPKTVCVGSTGDQCTDYMLMDPDVSGQLGFSLRGNYPAASGAASDYVKEFYYTCGHPYPPGQCPGGDTLQHVVTFASRSIADSTGAHHPLALISTGVWRAADGSGYQVRSLDDQGDMETITPEGAVNFSGVGETSACSSTDANGNQLCAQDTMGRPWAFKFYPLAGTPPDPSYCTGSLTTTATSTISVPAISGGFAIYKACYATINVDTTYNVDEGTVTNSADVTVMQSLVLPDNTAWGFSYDTGTGNLNKVTYPTGASISYSWSAGLGSPCSLVPDVNGALATRSIDANDGKGPQRWNYAWTTSGGYNWSVDVTDPSQNDTVTQFLPVYASPGCSYFPQVVTSYQGPASNNQVLKTVTTQYTSPASAPYYLGVVGVYPGYAVSDQLGWNFRCWSR